MAKRQARVPIEFRESDHKALVVNDIKGISGLMLIFLTANDLLAWLCGGSALIETCGQVACLVMTAMAVQGWFKFGGRKTMMRRSANPQSLRFIDALKDAAAFLLWPWVARQILRGDLVDEASGGV